jgi:formylmethanofuran dehydrogenase subunit A
MRVKLTGGRLVDPTHPDNGKISDLYIVDGRLVDGRSPPATSGKGQTARPAGGSLEPLASVATEPAEGANKPLNAWPEHAFDRVIDLRGMLVLAGGIDLHTHIGGGKVNLARLLMDSDFDQGQRVVWPTVETGKKYAAMGYTTCFEPAMLLSSARHTHLELADTPLLDSGAYVVLGNEDWLLEALSQGIDDVGLQAMIGWSLEAAQAKAVKVVNPGGINAFRYDQRMMDVDQPHPRYGLTPGEVIRRMTATVDQLGLSHPLHVHASNLGAAGNIESTLKTLAATDGHRLHLTHAQFNCYSAEGPFGIGSGAQRLANYVNAHPNITLDVGQIVFGQTVTLSADIAAQFRNRKYANPRVAVVEAIECQGGCGMVPIRYEDTQYVHSLQWSIGLELMLLVDDPWRVFLTTDHPNGGPFTSYPHLMRLLMDVGYRRTMLARLHPKVGQRSLLRELDREYTLDELAIATRAAPARILGLMDRGNLLPGSVADLAVYACPGECVSQAGQELSTQAGRPEFTPSGRLPADVDWERVFSGSQFVFNKGVPIIENGVFTGQAACNVTLVEKPTFDRDWLENLPGLIEPRLRSPLDSLYISDEELSSLIRRSHAAVDR